MSYNNYNKPKAAKCLDFKLDYTEDPNLFDETARKIAEAIKTTQTNQLRNFYDEVLKLLERSKKEDWNSVLPFVKMLNAKVAYANARKHASDEFKEFINECVSKTTNKDKLKIFKLLFEAVLGFSKNKI